jgi:hypothetical protein
MSQIRTGAEALITTEHPQAIVARMRPTQQILAPRPPWNHQDHSHKRSTSQNTPSRQPLKVRQLVTDAPGMSLVYLVIACAVAAIAYRASESFKRKNGVTPWHWPSWVWALVGFLSLVLCAVLLVIAQRRTKPVEVGFIQAPSPFASVTGVGSEPVLGHDPHPTPPTPTAAPSPSWYQDPTGRFASRYWDGSQWTPIVSDGNSTTSDPLPV